MTIQINAKTALWAVVGACGLYLGYELVKLVITLNGVIN